MKQVLNFQSEHEFQNFCSLLFSAEFDDFQAIEGSGGDGGLDGLMNETAIQVFYPEKSNRTFRKYIEKIDKDLSKLQITTEKFNKSFKRWVLIVPEDLRYEVVLHLEKKSKELGIICLHWGASKLTELLNKHPHIKNTFPGIFLPEIKEDLNYLGGNLSKYLRPRNQFNVEIITDKDFKQIDSSIINKYKLQSRGAQNRFGGSSAVYAADEAYRQEANRDKAELRRKKQASDRSFSLELEELNDIYKEAVNKVRENMSMRGIGGSGIETRELEILDDWKKREIEKLKLKYGKEE